MKTWILNHKECNSYRSLEWQKVEKQKQNPIIDKIQKSQKQLLQNTPRSKIVTKEWQATF